MSRSEYLYLATLLQETIHKNYEIMHSDYVLKLSDKLFDLYFNSPKNPLGFNKRAHDIEFNKLLEGEIALIKVA